MIFSSEIEARLKELGATYASPNGTLQEALMSMTFPTPMIEQGFSDHVEYSDDLRKILEHQGQLRELVQREDFTFSPWIATPLSPGTTDYEEWHDDEGFITGVASKLPTTTKYPNFIILGNTRYQVGFFVLSDDPHPQNPTVYAMDHDAWFYDIEYKLTFLDFLNRFATDTELREEINAYFAKASD